MTIKLIPNMTMDVEGQRNALGRRIGNNKLNKWYGVPRLVSERTMLFGRCWTMCTIDSPYRVELPFSIEY